jgi:CheY-like chemotaxis protein
LTEPFQDSAENEHGFLVVEDSIDEALLIKSALSGAFPTTVTMAHDGDQGLALLQRRHWDIAIVDLNLPGIDGIELTRAAKTFRPGMPVVAVTGYTSKLYMDEAYRAGADYVMTKPLGLEEFLDKIRELVDIAEPERPPSGPTVVAVGARPGDVEMGCGGILAKHAEQGHRVVMVVLGGSANMRPAATSAAGVIGARVLFRRRDQDSGSRSDAEWLREQFEELEPMILYVPSEREIELDRKEALFTTLDAGSSVPRVLAYQGPSTTPEFHPSVFVDVGPFMGRKLRLVDEYAYLNLPNTAKVVAEATARYWGRFTGAQEVEPLELLRG